MERQEVTAEALVDLPLPHDVRISPDGSKIIYSVSPMARAGKHERSSLWIADVHREYSARQLTSGLFNDVSPQWCPSEDNSGGSSCIAFISDRAKLGESSTIYLIDLGGGEPYPITKAENEKKIAAFKWSPKGSSIAYTSADETSAEKKAQDDETGDVHVYGQHWEFHRLRSVHVATRRVETMYMGEVHVIDFAWNPRGTDIAFVSQLTPDLNSPGYHGVAVRKLNISNKIDTSVSSFSGAIVDLVWSSDGHELYFRAVAAMNKKNSSNSLYKLNLADGHWERCLYGIRNCAVKLRENKGNLIVHVQDGLYDKLEHLGYSFSKAVTEEDLEIHGQHLKICGKISTWDALFTDAGLNMAFVNSDCSSPSEVYYQENGNMTRLSGHGSIMAKLQIGSVETVYCIGLDGTECDGVFVRPAHLKDEIEPLPTIVLIHGGPYGRSTVAFDLLHYYWVPFLVSAGYAVLCPNYRGGSSHGEGYASQARGAMGTTDYDDILSMLKHCISKGLVDESRVAIGGWSQGGFLSFLATTRQDFHFKAAICGAGVSDWDMMCMSSDAPLFEAELAGKAPWETNSSDTKARHGSAIWHMEKVKTPILIIHGEEDKRVPLNQAVAFHRGCLHHDVPCEMVTYPREGHSFKERKHMVDMLKRIRRFCDLHL